jgi:RNA polymerase sigma factor (sigma-70 family)
MSRDADQDESENGACEPAGLLAEHGRWLRTVLFARSTDPAAVDELFQEVAVAVLRRPPVQVNEAKRPAWLYGVAVRTAILHRRRLGRRRKLLHQLAAAPTSAASAIDPLGWLLAEERQKLVRQALARLGPKDRELLLLKYTEDWSYVEIADHLGATPSAVEARLHRARGRLRAELTAREVIEANS